MAVHLLTFHAYRSWSEDNPRGYVQKNIEGVQPPSVGLARHRVKLAKDKPVRFSDAQKRVLIEGGQEICDRRDWILYAASATSSHVHLLVGWKQQQSLDKAIHTLKRLLGLALSRNEGSSGNRWFSRGSDRKRVIDRRHFDHLIEVYLPKHEQEQGLIWINEKNQSH